MQLVAMGAQDVFLTGNPQITFFKVVYRRHTNFSKEAIKQEFTGSGGRRTCTLSRNGDLVQEIYLHSTSGWSNAARPANVSVEIGGQQIDKHYAAWLDIYDELFDTNLALKKVIAPNSGECFIPLRFWFNRNAGLALPLIALQYHEVKILVEANSTTAMPNDADLLVNYIYLDTDERRRFAQVSHEYLIEQVQHTGVETIPAGSKDSTQNKTINLTFNHPVKALFWTGMADNSASGSSENKGVASYSALLQLNGHDRFSRQEHMYFTGVQPYECGLRPVTSGTINTAAHAAGMYSFCLKPGEHQPSGSCNFSRIDNARLQFTTKHGNHNTAQDHVSSSLSVFALNYNVLRVMSGMGGLTYSN